MTEEFFPLNPGIIEEYARELANAKKAREGADKIEEMVLKRIDEVVAVICKFCKVPKCDWEINGDYGDYDDLIYFEKDNDSEFGCSLNPKKNNNDIDWDQAKKLENKYWDYTQGFPQKFLFMSNDKIIKHLEDEFAKSTKKTITQKEKQKIYREKTKLLKARLAEERNKIKKELGIK